jgi:hypothetical protein
MLFGIVKKRVSGSYIYEEIVEKLAPDLKHVDSAAGGNLGLFLLQSTFPINR